VSGVNAFVTHQFIASGEPAPAMFNWTHMLAVGASSRTLLRWQRMLLLLLLLILSNLTSRNKRSWFGDLLQSNVGSHKTAGGSKCFSTDRRRRRRSDVQLQKPELF
jgi:hypothetical protein